jgi:nicotinate phosphoribosyltransferase
LDEHLIGRLKEQRAAIGMWGVGTRLVTGYDQPALGGVYKLTAVRAPGGSWEYKVKLSEEIIKTTTPGIQQVRRFQSATEFLGDAIYDLSCPLPTSFTIIDPFDPTRRRHFARGMASEDLLTPIFRRGRQVYEPPSLDEVRGRAGQQLAMLQPGIKRFVNPDEYPVGLELGLHELKTKLVLQARREA